MCHRTTLFSLSDENRAIRWPPVSRKWYLSRHWINPSWLWSWTLNSLQMRHNFLLFIVTWFMVSCYSCLNGFQQCSVEGNFGLVDRCVLHVYTATRDNIIWLLRARQTFLVLYSWFLSLWIRMTWQGFENQDFWLYTSTRKINTSSLDFYDFFLLHFALNTFSRIFLSSWIFNSIIFFICFLLLLFTLYFFIVMNVPFHFFVISYFLHCFGYLQFLVFFLFGIFPVLCRSYLKLFFNEWKPLVIQI